MRSILLKLAMLIAVLAMPFGMGAAMASPGHAMPTAGDCDEHGGKPAQKAPPAGDCAMSCAMVVADPLRVVEPIAPIAAAIPRPRINPGANRVPEIATPPPKSA